MLCLSLHRISNNMDRPFSMNSSFSLAKQYTLILCHICKQFFFDSRSSRFHLFVFVLFSFFIWGTNYRKVYEQVLSVLNKIKYALLSVHGFSTVMESHGIYGNGRHCYLAFGFKQNWNSNERKIVHTLRLYKLTFISMSIFSPIVFNILWVWCALQSGSLCQ